MKPSQVLARTQYRRDLVASDEFAPDVLQDIAQLDHQDKEEQQSSVGSLETRDSSISSAGTWLTK